jgi:hypothetical protein
LSAALVADPVLQLALHGGAALLFFSAAAHKLRDLAGFRATLDAYGVLPAPALAPAAAALAAAEIAVGGGCLVPRIAPAACLAGAGLLALYSGAIALAWARGRRLIDCGCGGPGGRRPLSPGLLARNAALTALLLLATLPAGARTLVWIDAFTAVSLLAVLALLHAALDVALANAARLRWEGVPSWTTR